MEFNNIFHPRRFFLLLKEELFFGHRTSLFAAGAALLTLMLIAIANTAQDNTWLDFHNNWFPITLLGGGFVFSSIAFNQLNSKPGRQFYLSLPASTLEKFSVKWLITALFYPIALVLLYQVFAWLITMYAQSFNMMEMDAFQPLSAANVKFVKLYIVLQSIFLLGAIAFQKYSAFKTMSIVLLASMFIGFFTFLCIRIVFAEYWNGWEPTGPGPMPNQAFQDWMEFTLAPMMENLFWWVFAPFVLFIGFLKLKEKEV